MKKKSIKKFEFKVQTISNLQSGISGGLAPMSPKNSYENSCMPGYCFSINEPTLCDYCEITEL